MPPIKKSNKQYFFTVEGETEKWYLDWLQEAINADPTAKYTVSIRSKVEKNPLKFAKGIPIIDKVEITHWFDYESHDHIEGFLEVLDLLKQANSLKGKKIKYHLGYSNLTFELWMVLHKEDCNAHVEHRSHYLRNINSAYNERFTELGTYKHESNFKRVLRKLTLNDVRDAIRRANRIMQRHEENGVRPLEHRGFKYIRENPSLTVHESVAKILQDCGLL